MVRNIKNISIKESLKEIKNHTKRYKNYSASEAVSERNLKKQYLPEYDTQKKEITSKTKSCLESSNLGTITLTNYSFYLKKKV